MYLLTFVFKWSKFFSEESKSYLSELYRCVSNGSYSVLYLSGNRKDSGKEAKVYAG